MVMEFQGILGKICQVYGDDEEERKDLFQEILIQLWKSYPSFRGEAKFSTWMYQVAFNVAIQFLRKRKRRPDTEELTYEHIDRHTQTPGEDPMEEKKGKLKLAISLLCDTDKAIILLYLEERSLEEISEILGITPNHASVKIHRIKSKLKKLLTGLQV